MRIPFIACTVLCVLVPVFGQEDGELIPTLRPGSVLNLNAGGDSTQQALWFQLEDENGQELEVSTIGSAVDTILILQSSPAEGEANWTEVDRNDDFIGLTSRLRFFPEPGQRFRIGLEVRKAGAVHLALHVVTPALLPWIEAKPPSNDLRADALVLEGELPLMLGGNLLGAKADISEISGATVWYRWNRPADWPQDRRIRVEASGTSNLRLAVFGPESTEVQESSSPGTPLLLLDPQEFESFDLALGRSGEGLEGGFSLRLTEVEPFANETWRTPTVMEGQLPIKVTQDITGATRDDPDTTIERGGGGVWFSYTPTEESRLVISTFGSAFDTEIGVYRLVGGELELLSRNDDGPNGDTTSQLELDAAADEALLVCIVGFRGEQGYTELTISRSK